MSKYANAAAALRPQKVDLTPVVSAVADSEQSVLGAIAEIDFTNLKTQLEQMLESKLSTLENAITSSVTTAIESGDLSTLLEDIKLVTTTHRGEFDEFITALAGA